MGETHNNLKNKRGDGGTELRIFPLRELLPLPRPLCLLGPAPRLPALLVTGYAVWPEDQELGGGRWELRVKAAWR